MRFLCPHTATCASEPTICATRIPLSSVRLHTKFGQHEFLGPSSPDTFLGVPAHPGARLPVHVTDFPRLRFGTVDFDEAKRIAHLFSCFQFLCEQRPQYIVSVFPFLEL